MHWWKFKNIIFLGVSFLLAYIALKSESLHSALLSLGSFGYFGAFCAGVLFISTFTVATGSIILMILAESLSPVEIGLVAGIGAVVGDFIIFKFVKDDLASEIKLIYNKLDKDHHLRKLFSTKYFSWTLPVIGAIVIASPLPDEIGISLMGLSKIKTPQFLLLSFILNFIGIFLVVSAATVIKL